MFFPTTTDASQFTNAGKAHIDNFFALSQSLTASYERLLELNLTTSRQFLLDAKANANAAMGLKDQTDILAFSSNVVQPSVDKAINYSRQMYTILAENQGTARKTFEEQLARTQQEAMSALDQSLKNAPPGTETLVAGIKSAVAGVGSAIDTNTRAFKQSLDVLEGNLSNAAKAMSEQAEQAVRAQVKK